jgi:hypothetical protein
VCDSIQLFYGYERTAEFRRRQARDLEVAKERQKKVAQKQGSINAREESLKKTEHLKMEWEGPSKLLAMTKAAEAYKISNEELDGAEQRRLRGSAHSSRVASGGYDLRFVGRAIPAWRKGLGH